MAKPSIDNLLQKAMADTADEVARLTKEIDDCHKIRFGCLEVGLTEASKSIADVLKRQRDAALKKVESSVEDLTRLGFHAALQKESPYEVERPTKNIFEEYYLLNCDLAKAMHTDEQLEKLAKEIAGRLGCVENRPSIPELAKNYHRETEHLNSLVFERKKAETVLDGLRSAVRELEPVVVPEFAEVKNGIVFLQPGQKIPPSTQRLHHGDGPSVSYAEPIQAPPLLSLQETTQHAMHAITQPPAPAAPTGPTPARQMLPNDSPQAKPKALAGLLPVKSDDFDLTATL